jgi:amphiphysin
MGAEYNLAQKHPNAEVTAQNIGMYQQAMEELRGESIMPLIRKEYLLMIDTLSPELELIESRIVQPCKDLQEICKKIRKTCTKRDHKLIDFDRHNNALNKLREKKEKSLSDEKNLFKVEQDFELSSGEYEHYNNLLKTELPQFIAMATRFIDPLFHSFYYMQYVRVQRLNMTDDRLNVYYIMLEKVQSFADGKYDLERKDIENIYFEQRGDVAEQLEEMSITKRGVSTGMLLFPSNNLSSMSALEALSVLDTSFQPPPHADDSAKLLSQTRSASGSTVGRSPSIASKTTLGRQVSSGGSAFEKKTLPPPAGGVVAAPPPYTTSPSSQSITTQGSIKKKAPPPPPPLKPKPSYGTKYATAIFDFEAQVCRPFFI